MVVNKVCCFIFIIVLSSSHIINNVKNMDELGRNLMCVRTLPSLLVNILNQIGLKYHYVIIKEGWFLFSALSFDSILVRQIFPSLFDEVTQKSLGMVAFISTVSGQNNIKRKVLKCIIITDKTVWESLKDKI